MTNMEIIVKAIETSKDFAELVRNLQTLNNDLFVNESKVATLAEIAKRYI